MKAAMNFSGEVHAVASDSCSERLCISFISLVFSLAARLPMWKLITSRLCLETLNLLIEDSYHLTNILLNYHQSLGTLKSSKEVPGCSQSCVAHSLVKWKLYLDLQAALEHLLEYHMGWETVDFPLLRFSLPTIFLNHKVTSLVTHHLCSSTSLQLLVSVPQVQKSSLQSTVESLDCSPKTSLLVEKEKMNAHIASFTFLRWKFRYPSSLYRKFKNYVQTQALDWNS